MGEPIINDRRRVELVDVFQGRLAQLGGALEPAPLPKPPEDRISAVCAEIAGDIPDKLPPSEPPEPEQFEAPHRVTISAQMVPKAPSLVFLLVEACLPMNLEQAKVLEEQLGDFIRSQEKGESDG